MAEIFYLPKMGQTMTEGTILKWLKAEGDRVESWEGIVEMMTDKINMEVEPGYSGVLRKRLAEEGDVIPIGAPVAIIGLPDEDITALLASLSHANGSVAAAAEAAAQSSTPSLDDTLSAVVETAGNGEGLLVPPPSDAFPSVSPRAREAAAEAGLDWKSLQIPGTGFEGMIVERDVLAFLQSQVDAPREPLSTPLAAKIAADLGVSMDDVVGSGPRGRVTADDVRNAAKRRRGPSIQASEIKLQGMRKVIASRLSASYQQAVHVPLRVDADMTAAADLRRQLKPALEASGTRLTYTDLIAMAVTQALVAQPALNATLEGDVLKIHPNVNLGIAVALDDGLTVPVVREADLVRLPELSQAIQEAATGARNRTLPPDAFIDGTFTITNLGQFGIDNFDPIINPPQVAILGVGSIQDRVVAVNGAPAVRPMMTLTLVFDHRALDGAPGARFLSLVKELLENPARLLL